MSESESEVDEHDQGGWGGGQDEENEDEDEEESEEEEEEEVDEDEEDEEEDDEDEGEELDDEIRASIHSDTSGRRSRFWACKEFEDGCRYEGEWEPETGVDIYDVSVSREMKMGKMDGSGCFTWPGGRRFDGIFSAGFPKEGRLIEENGDVYSVQYSGDGTLQGGAEPSTKTLTVDYVPAELQVEKLVTISQLLESSPVDAYIGSHSGLLGHTVPFSETQRYDRSCGIAGTIRNVVGTYISHGHLPTVFRSQEGLWRKESTSILEMLSRANSGNESGVKSAQVPSVNKKLSDPPISQMDLMLQLLCTLVVNTADEARACASLVILQRFLERCTPGMLSSPANLKDSGFTESHLDQYTEMVEQLFTNGSSKTKDVAAQCLMGISTARGGLRHIARAVTFLQVAGGTVANTAMTSIETMLNDVGSILQADVMRSNEVCTLDTMIKTLWDKFGPGIGPLPESAIKASKILLFGLIRLFARSLSRLNLDSHDLNSARIWLESLRWFADPLQEQLVIFCNEAVNSAGCPAPLAVLEDGLRCQLTWAPSKLVDNMPPDTFQCRVKESGVVKIHGNGQLRPFEQVLLSAVIEKLLIEVFSSKEWSGLNEPLLNGIPNENTNAGASEEIPAQDQCWTRSHIWKVDIAQALLREILRATEGSIPLTTAEKHLVDPCDDVLTFLTSLIENKFSVIEAMDTDKTTSDVHMASEGKEKSDWSCLTAAVRLLLINVTFATSPLDSCQPRDLSLKVENGDIAKLSVSTNADGVSRLIDESPTTYWESSGSVGNHVIEITLSDSLVLSSVGLRVDRQDGSYCPRKLEISLLKNAESKWKVFSEKTIEPRGNQICMLAEELDSSEEYRSARIRIIKNFDNGNDSRVRGLKITGCPVGSNKSVQISESVANKVLICAQNALRQIRARIVSRSESFEVEERSSIVALLNLEGVTKALLGAASVLTLVSSKDKAGYLMQTSRESRFNFPDPKDPSHSSLPCVGDIALAAAFNSVTSPMAGLELLNSSHSEPSRKFSMKEDRRFLEFMFEYGFHEVKNLLSGQETCHGRSSVLSFDWLQAGRSPCVNLIAQVQAGILSPLVEKDSDKSFSVEIEEYIALYCAYACRVLSICQELVQTEKGKKERNNADRSWPKKLERALSRSFLSLSLGPLMISLSHVDWIRMESRTADSLKDLMAQLLPLAEADSGCRSVLNGAVDSGISKAKCPAGHELQRKYLKAKSTCTCCDQEIPIDAKALSCQDCLYNICRGCTYLAACHCSKRIPGNSCRPSTWIALAISGFYNCAAKKPFEINIRESHGELTQTSVLPRYRLLLAGGLQHASAPAHLEEQYPSGFDLLQKIRLVDGFSLSSETMSIVNAMDVSQISAVAKIFFALLQHCKLDPSILNQDGPFPKIFVECYLKSTNIVVGEIRKCRITNQSIPNAIEELTTRANFLLQSVRVISLPHSGGPEDPGLAEGMADAPITPILRESSDPPFGLIRQRSNTGNPPVPLFPTPLIRSESQNSVTRRSNSLAVGGERELSASTATSLCEHWEVGDRREIAESVVRFVCDKSLNVDEVGEKLKEIESLGDRHCRALHLINELTRTLSTLVPNSSLKTSFVRMVLVNLQGCRAWMEAVAIKCAAMDAFRKLLKEFLQNHVLAALTSEHEDEKLCGIAALSAAWRDEEMVMLVSSGIWDGVLSLCHVNTGSISKDKVSGHILKPIKLAVDAKVKAHSASANVENVKNVLDTDNTSTYWQSDVGSNPERWIVFEISPPQIVQQVFLFCADDQDRGSGYAPRDITIEVGQTLESLERIAATSIPQNTNGAYPLLPGERSTRPGLEPCMFVKFRILECGGRNCRVRGMSFDLKQIGETSANLPAVTVLSRAAATAVVLTGFSRFEHSKMSAVSVCQINDCKRTVIAGLISILQQSHNFDSSTLSFTMGLIALCLPGSEILNLDNAPGYSSHDLVCVLLNIFAREATEVRIIAQSLGLLQSVMKSCTLELCDTAAAMAKSRISGQAMNIGDDESISGPGCKFLSVVCEFLNVHSHIASKFLVARQSLTELILELATRPGWKHIVRRFAQKQLEILFQESTLHMEQALLSHNRARYALCLFGGNIPILQVGCHAQLDSGEYVRVLHYEFGDSVAGVVMVDGSITFVNSSSLEMRPLPSTYLLPEDLHALLPLFKLMLRGGLDDKPNFGLMDVYTRLLRCVVEHAEQRPSETGQFLDENKILHHIVKISMRAKPKGCLTVSLNCLEEQLSFLESYIRFDESASDHMDSEQLADENLLGADHKQATAPGSLAGAARESGSEQSNPSPKYVVPREQIWSCFDQSEDKSMPHAKFMRSKLEAVHRELSMLYGLKTALYLLPALPKCAVFLNSMIADDQQIAQDAMSCDSENLFGDITRQLLEKGIICRHPVSLIEDSILALTSSGGSASARSSCGLELLKCIQNRLVSHDLQSAQKVLVARQTVEAFTVGSRNSEWNVSMEFVGSTEFRAHCDRNAKLLGTLVLQSQKGASAPSQPKNNAAAAKDVLATFKTDDDKTKLETGVAGKGSLLQVKFSPTTGVDAGKVIMRMVAESNVNAVVVESEHKYKDNVSYRGSVEIIGAIELSIEFDKKCNTESGCDKLTFFSDELYKSDSFSSAHECSGSGESNWRNFSVKSNKIFYTFSSDSSRNEWGYRFIVKALGEVPLNDEANAQLTIASRTINAALMESSLLKSMQTREWCQVLANVCTQVRNGHRRSFLGCLSRLVASASEFQADQLPDDPCFAKIVQQFVSKYEENIQIGEPAGTAELLSHALFVLSWDSCGLQLARKSAWSRFDTDLEPPTVIHNACLPKAFGCKEPSTEKSSNVMVTKQNYVVGMKVVRGKHWRWGDQDGGEGQVGVVVENSRLVLSGWCQVRWANSTVNEYRVGANSKYDLYAHPDAPLPDSKDSVVPSAENIKQLTDMGFSRSAVLHALQVSGDNLQAAMDWMLDSANEAKIQEFVEAEAAAKLQSSQVQETREDQCWNSSSVMEDSPESGSGSIMLHSAPLDAQIPFYEIQVADGAQIPDISIGLRGSGDHFVVVFSSDGNSSLAGDAACTYEVVANVAATRRPDATLEGVEVTVGMKIMLAEGYRDCGDAASGPLSEGAEGVIVETSREPGGRVRASTAMDSDRRWWYDRKALMMVAPSMSCRPILSESSEFRSGDRVAIGMVLDFAGAPTGEIRLVKNGCIILHTCQVSRILSSDTSASEKVGLDLTPFVWVNSDNPDEYLRPVLDKKATFGSFLLRDCHPAISSARSLGILVGAANALLDGHPLPPILSLQKSGSAEPLPAVEWSEAIRQSCALSGDLCSCAPAGYSFVDSPLNSSRIWSYSAYCSVSAFVSVQPAEESGMSLELLERAFKTTCQPELRASFRELLGVCEGDGLTAEQGDKLLRERAQIVARLSVLMLSVLSVVNFSSMAEETPFLLGTRPALLLLRHMSRLVLKAHKDPVVKKLLARVSKRANERPTVSLDRFRAHASSETGENSVFGQVYAQIGRSHGTNLFGDRWWRVSLQGESVSDGGGAFRDSLSTIAAELMTDATPLFIEAGGAAWGRCVVPNPSCHDTGMFEFVGQLMGACLHSGERLALTLPPFVWRKLAGQPVGWEDFAAFEPELAALYDQVERNEFPESDSGGTVSYTAEMFEDCIALDFTLALGVPVRTVELLPGGSRVSVTLENRHEFVRLARDARLRSYDAQIRAMRAGLVLYCPELVLALWNSFELESAVCGEPDIPLDKFKETTRFQGDEAQKTMFLWSFEQLNMRQRSLLLRFVTGRSRLPCPITVDFGRGPPDGLPRAATCGNHLTLPPYTTQQRMLDSIKHAIEVCQDFGAEG